jgi:ribosomal protein S18 acetylase RimI-like enzyme
MRNERIVYMASLQPRALENRDLAAICSFPSDQEELFYIGPKFAFPLTPEQILSMLDNRISPTVIVDAFDLPLAYANLYDLNVESSTCWLGNVIVSPSSRGQGVAELLLKTMVGIAHEVHAVTTMKLYCHNTNTRALLFYGKHGFTPCGSKRITYTDGRSLVAIEMERLIDR